MSKEKVIFLFILLFFGILNIVWVYINQTPPMWDQALYLYCSEILYNTLLNKGIHEFLRLCLEILNDKAPLITILPLPFYIILGNSYKVALLVNLFFYIIANVYFFKLSKYFTNHIGALASVFVFNSFPIIFGLLREYLVEYSLTSLVIIYLYYLIKFDSFKDNKSFIIGIILGIGMLLKISFPIYVLVPSTYLFIKNFSNDKKFIMAKNVLLILVIAGIIVSPWYIKNYSSLINYVYSISLGEFSAYYSMGFLDYYIYHINYGLSFFYFIIILVLIVLKILFLKKRYIEKETNIGNLFLILSIILPLVVFTISKNKDYRYLSPIYPIFALLIGKYSNELIFSKNKFLFYFIFIISAFNFIFISFYPVNYEKRVGNFIIISNNLMWAHYPIKDKWPIKEIIEYLEKEAYKDDKVDVYVTLLFDHYYLNGITFNYLSKNLKKNLSFRTNDFFHNKNISENIFRVREDSDFVLTKSGKYGNESLLKNTPTIDLLNSTNECFVEIAKFYLPDNTIVTIFKNKKKV